MADRGRREQERRAAGGDTAARTRHLAERLRSGALTREQVERAAYLGDPAALALAPDSAAPDSASLWLWVKGLPDRESHVRAALAIARRVAPRSRSLDAIEAWIRDPSEENRAACAVSAWGSGRRIGGLAADAVLTNDDQVAAGTVADAAYFGAERIPGGDETIRGAVREALVPWCLGEGDPLLSGEADALVRTGTDLRHWRKAAGLSQRVLAERLGVSVGAVGKAERAGDQELSEALQAALAARRM